MRLRGYTLFLVAFFQFFHTPATFATPAVDCTDPVFDFGELYSDESVVHEFVLENTGSGLLQVKQIVPHCGCTTAALDTTTLAPGETTGLTVFLDLKGKKGQQRIGISVESNDPKTPVYELILTGNVIPPISSDPPRIDFGVVNAGLDRTERVRVSTSRDNSNFSIKDLHVDESLPCVAVAEVIDDSKSYEIAITLQSARKRGYFSGRIDIHTNDPAQPTIPIDVSGDVLCEILVQPPKLVLSNSMDAESRQKPLYLRVLPGTEEDFSITSVKSPFEGMATKYFRLLDGGYIVSIVNLPPVAELKGMAMTITTNLSQDSSISVPFIVIPVQSSLTQ